MTTKKKIFLILFTLVTIGLLAYKISEPDILVGEANNIIKITITYEPCTPNPQIISIENRKDIENINKLINAISDIRVVQYPRHFESIQTDSRFDIDVEYKNGRVEQISSTESGKRIYRKLDTRGSSGDPGFVSGSNENLWNYIKTLFSKKT